MISDRVSNCHELYKLGERVDGVYKIYPNTKLNNSIDVYCELANGGWTRIMYKADTLESTFHKSFNDYEQGFGNPLSSNWIGLENMFYLTNQQRMSLRVEFSNWKFVQYVNEYESFILGPNVDGYRLHLGKNILSTIDINFHRQDNQVFSTFDNNHGSANCANLFNGGWWFEQCYSVCLTCQHQGGGQTQLNDKVQRWYESIKMLIRPN